jgi:benzil reductase ((S)-benzoin forming)
MEKIAIITGGSRGIGLGLAQEFHKEGYRIITLSRTLLEKTYAFEQYSCDLTDHEQLDTTLNEVFRHFDPGNTDRIYLINNAGYLGTVDTLDHIPSDNISYTIQINLVAPLILSGMFIRLTDKWKCTKKILNISSGAAVNPYESWAMYCSSKAGLDMMTRVIAKEQKDRDHGVEAVSIYPGVVDTEMQTSVRSIDEAQFKHVQRFKDLHEYGQLADPVDVARKIIDLDKEGELRNGRVLDVRDFA